MRKFLRHEIRMVGSRYIETHTRQCTYAIHKATDVYTHPHRSVHTSIISTSIFFILINDQRERFIACFIDATLGSLMNLIIFSIHFHLFQIYWHNQQANYHHLYKYKSLWLSHSRKGNILFKENHWYICNQLNQCYFKGMINTNKNVHSRCLFIE